MKHFIQFHGYLAMMFGGQIKLGRNSSKISAVKVPYHRFLRRQKNPNCGKSPRSVKIKIIQETLIISSLGVQNQKLNQLLDPKVLVDANIQAVSSSLKISQGNKPNGSSRGSNKPYLGHPLEEKLFNLTGRWPWNRKRPTKNSKS